MLQETSAHPNWENATPEELRVAMEAAPTRRGYLRLNAMRLLLLGYTRAQAVQITNRSDRMVRLWIELFNRGGIDALVPRKSTGRPRKVKLERVRDLLVPVLENPAQAGVVHWTGVKVHGYLKEHLCVDLGYRTAVGWLHDLNFNLRFPRPWPERQNEQERQAYRERLTGWTNDPTIKLWFCDECGVEGDPRPRRRWVQPGKPRSVPYQGDHIRQNVVGAVSPQTGELMSLIVDGVDADVFQFFVDQLAETVPKVAGQRQLLIMDNASWHKAGRMNWHHFEPVYLPGYSPDYNPIERLWLRLKADWFWDFIARTQAELTERLCTALNAFIANPTKTASICSLRK